VSQTASSKHIFLAVGALLGWGALILQFYLLMALRPASVPETVLRYFGYFTILTNILVALYYTILLLKPGAVLGRFFSSAGISIAITVYISFVGIAYQFLLRHLWHPQGLALIADELLHSVIPVLFVLYWFLFAQKRGLSWKNVPRWLLYPLSYLIYALIRGALSGWYPYPFIDVNRLGYPSVLINSACLLVGFILLALLYLAIAKIIVRTRSAQNTS
jgi:hypothetical protein